MVVYEGLIANHNDIFHGQIEIDEKGIITRVIKEEQEFLPTAKKFKGECIIFPGFIDVHTHCREDSTGKEMHKEEYRTAANAALNGGIVHISAMPNTPNPLVNEEQLEWHENRIKKLNHPVDIQLYVGVGPGTRPLKRKMRYKVMTCKSVGPLMFRDKDELEETLRHYAGENVSFHVEDQPTITSNMHKQTHTERRPVECVETALAYVLKYIEKYDIEAKLCHWSTGGKSLEMIEDHRERMAIKNLGYNTIIEASPLHIIYDADILRLLPQLWPYVQMNPAIQPEEHRLAIINALWEGIIDMIALDHAPHTLDEKFKQFEVFKDKYPTLNNEKIYLQLLKEDPFLCTELACMDGTSGAPWLDTHALVAIHLMDNHGFDYNDIARICSYNPGKSLNGFLDSSYGKGFGMIAPGYQGSLTVLNMSKETTVERKNLQTKCGWSPLEGRTFSGAVEAVIIKGKDVTHQFS